MKPMKNIRTKDILHVDNLNRLLFLVILGASSDLRRSVDLLRQQRSRPQMGKRHARKRQFCASLRRLAFQPWR